MSSRKERLAPHLTNAGLLLEKWLENSPLCSRNDFFTITNNFEKIFGESLSKYMKIVDLNDSVLTVKALNFVWKNELEYQKKAIIDRCNEALGAPRVKALRFI